MDERNTHNDNINKTITIPNGIHVIEVYAEAIGEHMIDGHPLYLFVSSNNKQWYHGRDDDDSVSFQGYIGVTQNKQYSIGVFTRTRGGDSSIDSFYIRYSPEINNKTPTVTDY